MFIDKDGYCENWIFSVGVDPSHKAQNNHLEKSVPVAQSNVVKWVFLSAHGCRVSGASKSEENKRKDRK